MALDEGDGLLGIAPGKQVQIGRALEDFVVPHQFGLPALRLDLASRAVVRRSAEEVVETLVVRHQFGTVGSGSRAALVPAAAGEVPLADQAADIIPCGKDLGDSQLVGMQHGVRALGVAGLADANRIAAREQRRSGGPADVLRIEVRQSNAFGGHAVDVGRSGVAVAVASEIAIAEIVGEDDDEIRGVLTGGKRRRQAAR